MGTHSTPFAGIGRIILRAILPAAAAVIAISISLPAACAAAPSSVTESSQTYKDPACNFIVKDLENEIAETTASLKNCLPAGANRNQSASYSKTSKAKECAQYERKLKLTKENLLHVREQCDKGLTPDYLPKVIENPDAVPCAQCGVNKSLPRDPPAKVLTGFPLAGKVMDLKGGDPVLSAKLDNGITPLNMKAAPALAAAGYSCRPYTIPSCAELPLFMQGVDQDIATAKGAVEAWERASDSEEKRLRLAEWRAELKCMEDKKAAVAAATAGCGKCSAGQDLVNGNCVPKCTGGQTRNAAGACECPAGQIFSAGKCGCPSGQTLTAEGKCAASGGGAGGAVQPPPAVQSPAKGSGFWATKAGKFLKAIGVKWIWDNLLKPIVDFFAGIYHKIKGDTGNCGGNRFNPDKECCANGTIVEKCGQKTKHAGAFDDVYNNRDTIIATAKKYNIPATVLAGVVFTERYSTIRETWTDPISLYVRTNPSFGLTQVSVGIAYMMDHPSLVPANYSTMTWEERDEYLYNLANNMPMDLKKAYKHALEADPKTSINYSARYLKFLQDQRGVKYPSDSLWVSDYSRGLTTTTTGLSRLGKIYDQNKEELYPILQPEKYPDCGCAKP